MINRLWHAKVGQPLRDKHGQLAGPVASRVSLASNAEGGPTIRRQAQSEPPHPVYMVEPLAELHR